MSTFALTDCVGLDRESKYSCLLAAAVYTIVAPFLKQYEETVSSYGHCLQCICGIPQQPRWLLDQFT